VAPRGRSREPSLKLHLPPWERLRDLGCHVRVMNEAGILAPRGGRAGVEGRSASARGAVAGGRQVRVKRDVSEGQIASRPSAPATGDGSWRRQSGQMARIAVRDSPMGAPVA